MLWLLNRNFFPAIYKNSILRPRVRKMNNDGPDCTLKKNPFAASRIQLEASRTFFHAQTIANHQKREKKIFLNKFF